MIVACVFCLPGKTKVL